MADRDWRAMLAENVTHAATRWAEREIANQAAFLERNCESEIEGLFTVAFLERIGALRPTELPYWNCNASGRDTIERAIKDVHDHTDCTFDGVCLGTIYLFPQCQIEKWRCDLLVLGQRSGNRQQARLAIECDGHDFHERTPRQAERDRSRDRAFQRLGLRVLRFTGSEIVRDPRQCADEAARFLAGELGMGAL